MKLVVETMIINRSVMAKATLAAKITIRGKRFFRLSFPVLAFICSIGCKPGEPPDSALINLIENPAKGYQAIPEKHNDCFLDDFLKLVYRRQGGKVVWARKFTGHLGGIRPPHLLCDKDRVFVSHENGILALNKKNGRTLWYQQGPNERMCLNGNAIYAVTCGYGKYVNEHRRWLFARNTKTGGLIFKYELPIDDDYDPVPVMVYDDVIVVQILRHREGKYDTKIIEVDGRMLSQLDYSIVDIGKRNSKYYVVSDKKVNCFGGDWKPLWALSFLKTEFLANGRFIFLNNNTALAYLYCPLSDSGVQLMKLDTESGQIMWNYTCRPLGVSHTGYSHRVEVEVRDGNIRVTSAGYWKFIEKIDLKSGKPIDRHYESASIE